MKIRKCNAAYYRLIKNDILNTYAYIKIWINHHNIDTKEFHIFLFVNFVVYLSNIQNILKANKTNLKKNFLFNEFNTIIFWIILIYSYIVMFDWEKY